MAKWHAFVASNRATLTKFAQHTLLLDAKGALFFVNDNTLVVSDLHLEKGSYLSRFASPLANYDTMDTLKRLASLIADYQPHHLVCLGDSFHDAAAHERIEQQDWDFLCNLMTKVPNWTWVLGNHDPALPQSLPGQQVESLKVNDIRLCHEPEAGEGLQIVGHYHPKYAHKAKRQSIRGKCFVANASLMVMPAFGSYTGGLSINHEVMIDLLGTQSLKRFLIHQDKIWPL